MAKTGQCISCKEWTEVPGSCCGAGVVVEGHIYYDEDFQDDTDAETTSSRVPQSKAHLRESKLQNYYKKGCLEICMD